MDSSQLVQDTAHNQIIIKGLAHSSLQGNGQGKDNNHRMMMIEKKTELVLELTLPMLHVEPRMYGLKIVHKRTHDHAQNSSRPRTRFRSRSRTRSRRGGQTYTFSFLDMEDDYEEDGKMVTHTSHTHTHSHSSKLSAKDDSWNRNVQEIVVNNVKKMMHNHADEFMQSYGDRSKS